MQMEDSCRSDVLVRMRRVQGQVAGIIAMIEDGRDCVDVVTQLSAASSAMNRAGFKVVSDGMQQCATAAERGEEPPIDPQKLEKLFLSLT